MAHVTHNVYPQPELADMIEESADERDVSVSSWYKNAARRQLQREELKE